MHVNDNHRHGKAQKLIVQQQRDFKKHVASATRLRVILSGAEIHKVLSSVLGEGLTFGIGKNANPCHMFYFWDDTDPDFHVLIPVGTHYELNVRPFLEFDEVGPYIKVKTSMHEAPYFVNVKFQRGVETRTGVQKFVQLPKFPKSPKSDGAISLTLYLLKLWSFKALSWGVQVFNLRRYYKAMQKGSPLAIHEAENASSEDADELNKILSDVDG